MAVVATVGASLLSGASVLGTVSGVNNIFYATLTALDNVQYNRDDCQELVLITKTICSRWHHVRERYVEHYPELIHALEEAVAQAKRWCDKYERYGWVRRFCFSTSHQIKFARLSSTIQTFDRQLCEGISLRDVLTGSLREAPSDSDGNHSPFYTGTPSGCIQA